MVEIEEVQSQNNDQLIEMIPDHGSQSVVDPVLNQETQEPQRSNRV